MADIRFPVEMETTKTLDPSDKLLVADSSDSNTSKSIAYIDLKNIILSGIGAESLNDLTDVDLSINPTDLQVLIFDVLSSTFKPGTIVSGDTSSGLEKITENNKSGWRLIGKDPILFGPIGTEAVDFTSKGASGPGDGATGDYSHAEGYGTTSSGRYSHSEGNLNNSIGDSSHAEGNLNNSIGDSSHAEGCATVASGCASHSEGFSTNASGFSSHAEGLMTESSGCVSHSEGYVSNSQGFASHAEGCGTVSSGISSHAEGIRTESGCTGCGTVSQGCASHAEGSGTKAYGQASHAEGFNTYAGADGCGCVPAITGDILDGDASHAEGHTTKAYGQASHAEGYYSESVGLYSHSEGNTTKSNGNNSHAEGNLSISDGESSHAEGQNTRASGNISHVEGDASESTGYSSHAEGGSVISNGTYSHAEGYVSKSQGFASHAEGNGTIALNDSSHAEGKFNIGTSLNTIHETGIGTSTSDKKNAFEIYTDGTLTAPESTITLINSRGSKTLTSKEYVDNAAIGAGGTGLERITEINDGWRLIGRDPNNYGNIGIDAVDFSNSFSNGSIINGATGNYSHAEGSDTISSGVNSHAEGCATVASGCASHSEGSNTNASGCASHAEGSNTNASGWVSHAEGFNTISSGDDSHAEGCGTVASGINSHSEGEGTISQNSASHASGKFNVGSSTETIHETGIGSSTSVRKNAFEIYTDGTLTAPTSTIPLINSRGIKTLVSKEYVDSVTGGIIGPTGLELVTEGANSGWRYIGRNPDNYGDIGQNATDISYSTEPSGSGAMGDYSHVEGLNNASYGNSGHAEGTYTIALNYSSHAAGMYNIGTSTETIHETGIGTSSIRKNAFEIYTDGTLTAPESSILLIDTRGVKTLTTKEYVTDFIGKSVFWLKDTNRVYPTTITDKVNIGTTDDVNDANLVVGGSIALNAGVSDEASTTGYSKIYSKEETVYTGVDSYTQLLIHSDITDGSTSFIDSSSNNSTVYFTSGLNIIHHSTDKSVFGNTSIYSIDSGYLTISPHSGLNFNSLDFTLECWVNINSHTTCGILGTYGNGKTNISLGGTGLITGHSTIGGVDPWLISTSNLDINTWYHIALIRNGNILSLYINGVVEASGNVSGSVEDIDYDFQIVNGFTGYIDEVRVSKGIARWTDNFALPTLPYGSELITNIKHRKPSGDTQILDLWNNDINRNISYKYGIISNPGTTISDIDTFGNSALTTKEYVDSKFNPLPGYGESGSTITTNDIDLSLGNMWDKVISIDTSFTFTNTFARTGFMLQLTNAGSFNITWPTSVKWPAGNVPTLSTGIDVVSFHTMDSGITWFGAVQADFQ